MMTMLINVILNSFQDLIMKKMRCRNKFGMTMGIKRGFTLIELLVAIAIIGVLSSFLLANFVGVRQRARDGVRKSDLRQIQAALELYRADKGAYPPTDDFPACSSSFTDGAVVYMQKIPCDPSSATSYAYASPGSGGTYPYDLATCLENVNDSQLDKTGTPSQPIECSSGSKTWKYTLHNP